MKHWWHHDLVRNCRLALPPTRTLAALGLVYVLLEILQQVGQAIDAGQLGPIGRGPLWLLGVLAAVDPSTFQFFQARMICFAAALFGVYRATAYHPVFRDSYRKWLLTTCWRVGRALPLGPLTLTFSDVFLVAAAVGLLSHTDRTVPLLTPVALFAAAYLVPITVSVFFEGPRGGGYAILFGLLGMLMFGKEPEWASLVALPTYIVAVVALRQSLTRLPNCEEGPFAKYVLSNRSRYEQTHRQMAAAWPWGYLSPQETSNELPRFDAICIAVLAGWALFCLSVLCNQNAGRFLVPDDQVAPWVMGLRTVVGGFALVRLFGYCIRFRPPISIPGRFATGRWLIPSYDRVLVAPVFSVLLVWCLPPGFFANDHIPAMIVASATLTAALLMLLLPGPSYREWSLTSACRIVPQRPQ